MATTTRRPAETQKAGFRIDAALLRRFRLATLEQRTTMTDVLTAFIREWLARHEGGRRSR
jgi:hypothetical protein